MEKSLTLICNELKEIISQYSHHTFVEQCSFLSNAHVRQKSNSVKLKSPIRQLMYLISLYYSTGCKGTKYFEAYGDEYNRIVQLFYENDPFALRDKKGKVIETIKPKDFDEVFAIIVTQERFGQNQCDLSYLLQIDEDANFPWAVAIDDFETF